MCGGAIISEFIPTRTHHRRRRDDPDNLLSASDLWPDSFHPRNAPSEDKGPALAPAVDCSDADLKKLSEELMAYESCMNFFAIPYMEGGTAPTEAVTADGSEAGNPAVSSCMELLWNFDDVMQS
ncbi:ethylene-responsive transcription factor [Canna indica]|uniref:Ethylene-responsive transcription factor n=1 Tax=Canna indica TaxID=4628 RepID=A0AAQ3L348_9LILI|nr:ethylene-responsive transcription factor [Canna indica]